MNLIANYALAVLICTALATLRLAGVVHPAYQAVAHLYVGFLIGQAVLTNKKYWWLVIILSTIELFAALVSRGIL